MSWIRGEAEHEHVQTGPVNTEPTDVDPDGFDGNSTPNGGK